MTEKISIRNFAGIQLLDQEISRINLLIGPQATGKSICAKLLYYFKTFVSDLFSSIENQQDKREFDNLRVAKFNEYFPPKSLSESAFQIRYQIGKYFIMVDKSGGRKSKVKLSYSSEFLQERNHTRRLFRDMLEKHADEEEQDRFSDIWEIRKGFFERISSNIDSIATFNQFFIPAGRSFFANLQSSIFSFLSSNKAIDPFLTEFGSFYERTKDYPIHRRIKQKKELKKKLNGLIEMILCAKHQRERGKDYLISPDNRRIPISSSSSGQQEMLPLAVILSVFPFVKFIGGGQSVYIEEPEAHLFPTAQRHIVELIVTIFTCSESPIQFIITTHSPYILTAFNNLMQAASIMRKLHQNQKQKLYRIVPPEQLLDPQLVRAYSLGDGLSTNICSEETGLISTNVIDEVSNSLSIQFDNLLGME